MLTYKRKYWLVFFLFALFLLYSEVGYAQCAMCKQAAESSMKSDPNSVARSLNSGILYLMLAPYLLLCFIFRKQIASVWKKLRNKENPANPADQLP